MLRRSVCTVVADKKETLWELMSEQARNFTKENLLLILRGNHTKDMMHKLANLTVEVQGAMHEQNEDDIW